MEAHLLLLLTLGDLALVHTLLSLALGGRSLASCFSLIVGGDR